MARGPQERAAELESAAVRLSHAMHESHGPVDRMGAALERMMRALAGSARAIDRLKALAQDAPRAAASAALEDLDHCREALERQIATCIESLQFHDRLMQHLAHIHGELAAIAGAAEARTPPPASEAPHASGEARKLDLHAGSVELF